jgi:PPOX class probable F420-dependent enzyme
MLDLTKERDAHIDQRLRSDPITWLSTVRRDGRPHTVPVWFLWDGKNILIFSQLDNQKIRNLRNNPNVTLALDGTNEGGDVVVLEGKAELLKEKSTEFDQSNYITKYGSAIQEMGQTPESLAQSFSQPIRITPTKFIGWNE